MNCAEARAVLSAHADGELSAASAIALEAHARACPDCRRELGVLRALKGALAGLSRPEVPPDLASRLLREAQRPAARRPFGRRALPLALAPAAAAVALVALWVEPQPAEVPLDMLVSAHARFAGTLSTEPGGFEDWERLGAMAAPDEDDDEEEDDERPGDE